MFKAQRGFTLIELLVAIAIVAVISGIGFTVYAQSQIVARDGRRKQDMKTIQTALELFYARYGHYPSYRTSAPGLEGDSAGCLAPGNKTDWPNLFQYTYNPYPSGPKWKDPSISSQDFIASMPVDPINNCGDPVTFKNAYHYNYYAVDNANGIAQDYDLYFSVENKKDPQINPCFGHDICLYSPNHL